MQEKPWTRPLLVHATMSSSGTRPGASRHDRHRHSDSDSDSDSHPLLVALQMTRQVNLAYSAHPLGFQCYCASAAAEFDGGRYEEVDVLSGWYASAVVARCAGWKIGLAHLRQTPDLLGVEETAR